MSLDPKMKHPIICIFMVCIFTFMTVQPFMSSDAAQIWNKGAGKKKSGKSYYNRSQPSQKSSPKIYNNRTTTRKSRDLAKSKDLVAIRINPPAKKRGTQKPSKLWGVMTPNAVKNRQSNIDMALQREYEKRKITVVRMNKMYAEGRAHKIKVEQAYLLKMEEREAAKELSSKERKIQMRKAYAAMAGHQSNPQAKTSYKVRPKKNSKGTKKPARLFNDPNK